MQKSPERPTLADLVYGLDALPGGEFRLSGVAPLMRLLGIVLHPERCGCSTCSTLEAQGLAITQNRRA